MAGAAVPADPLEVLALEFGAYPAITPLNARFLPDSRRLKLTIDVHLPPGRTASGGRGSSSYLDALERVCSCLSRHVCCGDGRLRGTLRAVGEGGTHPAIEAEESVDVAHLLEHLIIDFQHDIADMRVCSGVTCGYQSPPNRFDIFVESPDEAVSRLCVSLACDLMNVLVRGSDPDPLYAKVVRLARHVYLSGGSSVGPDAAKEALGGDGQSLGALLTLAEMGFLHEIESPMNFSGVPLYAIGARERDRS